MVEWKAGSTLARRGKVTGKEAAKSKYQKNANNRSLFLLTRIFALELTPVVSTQQAVVWLFQVDESADHHVRDGDSHG